MILRHTLTTPHFNDLTWYDPSAYQ